MKTLHDLNQSIFLSSLSDMKYVTILYKFSVKESNLNSWCIIRVIRCNNNRRKQFFEVFIKYFFKYFLWNKKMHNLAKYIFMKNLLLIYFSTRYLIHVKYATNLLGMRHILYAFSVYTFLSVLFSFSLPTFWSTLYFIVNHSYFVYSIYLLFYSIWLQYLTINWRDDVILNQKYIFFESNNAFISNYFWP